MTESRRKAQRWQLRLVPHDHQDVQRGEHELRFRALREPLGYTRADVAFPFDHESLHLLAYDSDDAVVGCVLFHPEDASGGRLYQMAVAETLRGAGLGRALVERLEVELKARGFTRVGLHAREYAAGFYRRLGYEVEGEPFEEVGMPHFHMVKHL